MNKLVRNMAGILAILLVGTTVHAELQLVTNFEGMSGTRDGTACNGVLGGFIDTESEGTGNSAFGEINGSNGLNYRGHSSGALRAAGIGGITNPINDSETGIGFCRFMARSASLTVRTHIGLIANATDDPINETTAANPLTVPAGFRLVDNGNGFDVLTLDGVTVLKAGLARNQWYSVWIVADNSADTFDLYMSEAAGPAGAPALPTPAELVKAAIPFTVATTESLNCLMFSSPNGTGQAEVMYMDEIWWDGDQGLAPPNNARNPVPANGETDVARDVVLSWTAGKTAGKHDLYLGTSFDEVSSANTGSPMLVGPGLSVNVYEPGRLEFNGTYFWRVDELDAPPGNTVYKGDVWSFTVEPVAYPIAGGNIIASASSQAPDQGAEKTIDGSGLVDDLHSTALTDMWLTSETDTLPVWIKFEFDKIYKLHEMLIWNYNAPTLLSMLGLKDVIVECSLDGASWEQPSNISQFNKASGSINYAANTTVPFNGKTVKYVRITASSNHSNGLFTQYGLSEVRFTAIPVSARLPVPDVGETNVALDVTLGWRPGRNAAQHNVYISTSEQAVIDGTAPFSTVTEATSGPLSLDLGSMYFWRVDEVNNAETPSIWLGDVWSFTTQEYLVVDDFESYNDIEAGQEGSNLIYMTWTDGFVEPPAIPTNGSTIGYNVPFQPTMETDIFHSRRQSAPVTYNNSVVSISEVKVNPAKLAIGSDWTRGAPGVLSLWFYGDPNNAPERMYVKVNNAKTTYDGSLTTAAWQEFRVDLTAPGVNLSNVAMLTIGFERTGATGGSGTMLIDDIRLYGRNQ